MGRRAVCKKLLCIILCDWYYKSHDLGKYMNSKMILFHPVSIKKSRRIYGEVNTSVALE